MKRREAICLEMKLYERNSDILKKLEIDVIKHRDFPDEWCVVIW